MMENKDMPAFPQSVSANEVGIYLAIDANISDKAHVVGVTKLEFFACNAPVDVPTWFKHVPPVMEVTPIPRWQDVESQEDRELIKIWLDVGTDLPDHLKWYQEQFDKHIRENQDFKFADLSAKYFQWRRYYAEQLLLELSKPQP